MGFVLSILYIVTYYLTPRVIFVQLADFRIELILASLVVLLSMPKLAGSLILKTPQSFALLGLTLAVFLSVLVALHWPGGALTALLGFIPCALSYYLACLYCNSIKRLQVLVVMLVFVCLFVMANGYIELARGFQASVMSQPGFMGSSYLFAGQNETGEWIFRLRGLGVINDPNDFGQLLVCVIPLVFIIWKPKKIFRNLFFVLLPVSSLLFGTYMTHSRGALLALMAIVIVAFRRRIGTVPALLLGAGVFAAAMAMHFTGGRQISHRGRLRSNSSLGRRLADIKISSIIWSRARRFCRQLRWVRSYST